jgi:cobalt-zinc-cadmium efflux system outer membrane protein
MATARREVTIGYGRELAQRPNPTLEWRRENLGSSLQPDIFATLYLPIDATRRRGSMRAALGETRKRADAELAAEQRDAELRVARAWFRSAMAQQNAAIMREQLTSLVEFVRIARERVREGMSAEAALMRMQLEEERVRIAHLQAQIEIRKASAELATVLGVSSDSLPAVQSIRSIPFPAALDENMSIAVARLNRPEVRAGRAAVAEAEARMRGETRSALGGDWQLQGGTKQTSGFMTGQIGLAVPLPLFHRNNGARQRAQGTLDEARALHAEQLLMVDGEARSAWAAYSIFSERALDPSTYASQGNEFGKSIRVSYAEGHASLLELLDAERAATDAQLMFVRWTAEAWMARLEYERAMGARLGPDSPLDLPLVRDVLPSPPQ